MMKKVKNKYYIVGFIVLALLLGNMIYADINRSFYETIDEKISYKFLNEEGGISEEKINNFLIAINLRREEAFSILYKDNIRDGDTPEKAHEKASKEKNCKNVRSCSFLFMRIRRTSRS